jgi:methylmalonyl-CoA epimerase
MRIDHLGIAVRRLATSVPVWEATLGARASAPEVVENQRVRVAFLEAGESHLELLEPTTPESAVGRYLETRGEGLHHLAFAVPSVDASLADAQRRGLRLIDTVGRTGARGRRVGFVHPSGHAGVLVEFVEAP